MTVVNLKEFPDASEKTRELYNAVQEKYGLVPNFVKAMGDNPAFLEAILQMHSAVFDGGAIPPKYKNLIAMAVSMTNGCNYCTSAFAAHSQAMEGTEQELAPITSICHRPAYLVTLRREVMNRSRSPGPCDLVPISESTRA